MFPFKRLPLQNGRRWSNILSFPFTLHSSSMWATADFFFPLKLRHLRQENPWQGQNKSSHKLDLSNHLKIFRGGADNQPFLPHSQLNFVSFHSKLCQLKNGLLDVHHHNSVCKIGCNEDWVPSLLGMLTVKALSGCCNRWSLRLLLVAKKKVWKKVSHWDNHANGWFLKLVQNQFTVYLILKQKQVVKDVFFTH